MYLYLKMVLFRQIINQLSWFFFQIVMWWKKSDEEMMKIHVTPQVISSPNQSIDQVEGEILHLVAENRTLRKSLSEV